MVTASRNRGWPPLARQNRIKLLTGGDPVTTHFMKENSFTCTPQFKLLRMVPFNHKPVVPDLYLEDRLVEEWSGILRWAVAGAVGGTGPLWQVVPVAILRPSVLQEVERFIRVNQPPAAMSAHAG
jgi:phage/plasmid-associated DNA primase